MDFLRDIVGDELYGQLSEKVESYNKTHEPVKIANLASGNYVDKSKMGREVERESKEAQDTIKKLEEALSANSDLAKKVSDLQTLVTEFAEAEKRKVEETALRERFAKAKGEREFLNSYTEEGIVQEFKKALNSDENKGKSDSDILNDLVSNRNDVFANPHKPSNIPPMAGGESKEMDIAAFEKLSVDQQMSFANEHPDLYAKLYE